MIFELRPEDRKEPVTEKSRKRAFQAEGTTLGKNPKMSVSVCLGQRESCELRGEQRYGQGLAMLDLLDLAEPMPRRRGQSGYHPTFFFFFFNQ